ncbi:interleukin-13 receptor subunit alpha-1-like [Mantella aurantiaca]
MNVISQMSLLLPLIHMFIGHSAPEKQYLPQPTNITIGFNSSKVWNLKWTWEPPAVNCSLVYDVSITDGSGKKVILFQIFLTSAHLPYVSGSSSRILALYHFNDLNHFLFDLKVCCGPLKCCQFLTAESNSTCSDEESKVISLFTPLASGEGNTSVRNLSCVWYYLEYVNCTWQPAEVVPANVNYSLYYWMMAKDKAPKIPSELDKLLDAANRSHSYVSNEDGVKVGCLFQMEKSLDKRMEILMVVTDRSKNIKPFILYKQANLIVKLRPPEILNLSRIANQRLYIRWNTSHVDKNLIYQVIYRKPTHKNEENKTKKKKVNQKYIFSSCDTGVDSLKEKSIKVLIFPQIPNPGKMFKEDFQEWIQNGSMNQFHKPQKEEICPVSVLEMPLKSAEVD